MAYLNNPAGRRVRTDDHVERTNRMVRFLEKVRYKWRRRKTLVRFGGRGPCGSTRSGAIGLPRPEGEESTGLTDPPATKDASLYQGSNLLEPTQEDVVVF